MRLAPVLAAIVASTSIATASTDLVPFEWTGSFTGSDGAAEGLPPAAGAVAITFSSTLFRSWDEYGGGQCFRRFLLVEGALVGTLNCAANGCHHRTIKHTVSAEIFNAWRRGGISMAMIAESAQCGLSWSVRFEYEFLGVDRTDQFVGASGVSTGLPMATGDVLVDFQSQTFREWDWYGWGPCFERTLTFEDGVSIWLGCPADGCNDSFGSRVVPAAVFNQWRGDGVALLMQWGSSACGLAWSVRYRYPALVDCNGTARPDELDIALGFSPDCNGDGIPDECQGLEVLQRSSAAIAPFGAGFPASTVFSDLPPPLATAEITIAAVANLALPAQVVIPVIGGIQFPPLFSVGGVSCAAGTNTASVTIPAEQLLGLIGQDGSLEVSAIASGFVGAPCPTSSVTISIRYVAFTPAGDCDGDGVPDLCQFSGPPPDCIGNGRWDLCDIASGFDRDCNGNGIPDACEIRDDPDLDLNDNGVLDSCEIARGDLDLDGVVGPSDLAILLSLWGLFGEFVPDLDGNGIVGPGDLAILLANWGTTADPPCGNGVVNAFEDCSNCPEDVSCPKGSECIDGQCLPLVPDGGRGTRAAASPTSPMIAPDGVGYRHQHEAAVDPNFRLFFRNPLPSLSLAAILAAVAVVAGSLLRWR